MSPAARIYMQYGEDGCRWHRLLQPARHLTRADFPDVEFYCSVNHEPHDQAFDAYIMHGLLHWETYRRVAAWKAIGKRFAWSVDDDFLTVPDSNPAKPLPEFINSYYLSRSLADLIVCSTRPLADTFAGFRTAAAPNLLDLDYYTLTTRPAPDPKPLPLRVVWTGSLTHSRDVAVAEPAVRHLLTAHQGKVEVFFFGQGPPPGLVRDFLHQGLEHVPGVPMHRFWSELARLRPHVVLAPLDKDAFNRSKSNLRILEGWALSAAVVATDWSEYGVIRHGQDGLLAADSDEFTAHLDAVCTDPDLRVRLAEAGRKRVEEEWSWQSRKARSPWRAMVETLLEGVR